MFSPRMFSPVISDGGIRNAYKFFARWRSFAVVSNFLLDDVKFPERDISSTCRTFTYTRSPSEGDVLNI